MRPMTRYRIAWFMLASCVVASAPSACSSGDASGGGGDGGRDATSSGEGAAPDGTVTMESGASDATTDVADAGSAADAGDAGNASDATDAAVEARADPGALCGESRTACAVKGGVIKCWGSNEDGQLGQGTTDNAPHPSPDPVSGVVASGCATGQEHVCALVGASVTCWGYNAAAQLGHDPATDDSGVSCNFGPPPCDPFPSGVAANGVVAVGAGFFHSCALQSDGTVLCWGDDDLGRVGVADSGVVCPIGDPCTVSPTAVFTGADRLAVGGDNTCARKASDGTVWCWGANAWGELGVRTTDAGPDASGTDLNAYPTPIQVPGLSNVAAIAVGSDFACAVLASGQVSCWGANGGGELGHDPSLDLACATGVRCSTTPAIVAGVSNAREIALGQDFACAVLTDDTVSCWGDNSSGQLGHSPSADPGDGGVFYGAYNPAPALVPALSNVAHVTAEAVTACAMKWDGTVLCWGDNFSGNAGQTLDGGSDASPRYVPQVVSGL